MAADTIRISPKYLVLIALALIAVSLAACGSEGGDSSADEKEIAAAIVSSGTTDSESECTQLETQRFVEQIQAEKGEAAIASCEEPGDNNADSIQVSAVEVDEDKATAEATIDGGGFDGQTLKISLLKDDGRWKLDHLVEFVEFDKEKLIAALTASFQKSSGFSPEQNRCASSEVASLDDEKIQDIILSGDRNQLFAVIGPCLT